MNPRLPAGTIVGEPLENFGIARGKERDERVAAAVRAGRAAARRDAQVRARILGRPAPAARHRQGAVGQPRRDRGRRAGLGARRLGAGAGAEPADRPAGGAGPRLSLHQPRSRGDAAHQPSHRRDVSRPHRRARRPSARCSPSRCIPTPRRCCRPRPRPIRGAPSASGRSCRATCRARPTRRPAAISTRAAPMRWPSAR